MKNKFLPSVTLSAICLLVAALLASINLVTGPKIKSNNDEKANAALTEVLPGGEGFVDVEITDVIPESIDMIKKASDGSYVFRAVVTGKKSGMTVMIGINRDGLITGTKCTANTETPSYAEPVFDETETTEDNEGWYVGMDDETLEELIVAKSTLTSRAYANAVKDALRAFNILVYGTENENCNEALGVTGVVFTEWFKTESIPADALYYADGVGVVADIDGTFVGIRDGEVITKGVTKEESEAALASYSSYKNESLTPVTATSENELIESVYRTTGGNYLFNLNARGWGKDGDPDFASGEYIKIKLVIDKDGKILSIATVSEKESAGYGDACASPNFYESFVGADLEAIDGAASVSGATITSQGYKNAIKAAFEEYEKLTGGNG